MSTHNFCKKNILAVVLSAASIIVIIPYIVVLVKSFGLYPYTCMDSAIILSEMERIAEGWIPYHQMHLNYPPLWFYFMASLKKVFHIPYGCYSFYLIIQYIFLSGSAWMLYKFNKLYCTSQPVLWASVLYFLFMTFLYRAFFVIFEPISIFFGLTALYLTLTPSIRKSAYRYIFVGLLSSGAFLIKQFGLGFCLLNILLILLNPSFEEQDEYKVSTVLGRLMSFSIGLLIPIFLCRLYFGDLFWEAVLFNGYGTTVNASIGDDVSFGSKILFVLVQLSKFLFFQCPIVILIVFTLRKVINTEQWKIVLLAFCGIIGFAFQYYFSKYTNSPHYNQYMMPFVCMLIPVIAQWAHSNIRLRKLLCIALLGISVLYAGESVLGKKHKYSPSVMKQDVAEGECGISTDTQTSSERIVIETTGNSVYERIHNIVPKDKTLWIPNTSLLKYWIKTNRLPPNMKEIGYSTGTSELTPEKAERQINDADFILCQEGDAWDTMLSSKSINCFLIDSRRRLFLHEMP